MKKSQLDKLIKEEITSLLTENEDNVWTQGDVR